VVALLQEGISRGTSAKAIAGLFGLATRTLRRWGLMIRSEGFSGDRRKGAHRYVAHRFSREERHTVLETANDPRFADLTPSQIVAILAEEGLYVGSESTIYATRSCERSVLLPLYGDGCVEPAHPWRLRSTTLAAKMAELGISLSFSRPRVSNDNAYVESWFRTMKYHQSYPVRRFRDLLSVRAWVDDFVDWYNAEHRHSGIKYVTPNQRHYGKADAICSIRQQTYEQARQQHPRRWSRPPRDWSQPQIVRVNHLRP